MQKVLVFGQISEFLSTMIKSCCCKLWGKVTVVLININFGAKMSIFCKKKKEKKRKKFWRNDFYFKCALLLKVTIYLQNMRIFRRI